MNVLVAIEEGGSKEVLAVMPGDVSTARTLLKEVGQILGMRVHGDDVIGKSNTLRIEAVGFTSLDSKEIAELIHQR